MAYLALAFHLGPDTIVQFQMIQIKIIYKVR